MRLDVEFARVEQRGRGGCDRFVVLRRGGLTRRLPFWTQDRAAAARRPDQDAHPRGPLLGRHEPWEGSGLSYRYPDDPGGVGVSNDLPGPEQVFRVRIGSPVANFGVRVVSQGKGVVVSPRIVAAGDENRLQACRPCRSTSTRIVTRTASPRGIGRARSVPGLYDVVFDTRSRTVAGRFSFRLWLNDTTPPRSRVRTPSAPKNGSLSCLSSTVDQASTHGRSARSSTGGD